MYRAYLLVSVVVIALYALQPTVLLYQAVALSGVLAILVGLWANKPANRLPWYLFAMGQGTWFIGDVLYDTFDMTQSPSIADVAYLLAYPFLGAGLVLMIARRRRERDVPGLIDSLIVTVGLGLLSWVFVADPIVDNTNLSLVERAVATAYPIGDVLLLALVIRLVTDRGERSPAFRLMVASMGLVLIADTFFAVDPSSDYTNALDVLWLASYVLWGATALHPTMGQLSTVSRPRARPFSFRPLAAVAAAMLIVPTLVVARLVQSVHVDTWVIVGGACALTLLVVWRMAFDIEEIRETTRQRDQLRQDLLREASHDSLTGVANSVHLRQLIGAALRRGRRSGTPVGLMVVDLDDTGGINDKHGHTVGDEVLRVVACRLQEAARGVGSVGRLGGDQFVALIESVSSGHEPAKLADGLIKAISEPILLPGGALEVTACIGTTTSQDCGTDAETLLLEAQTALRRAKSAGRGQIQQLDNRGRSELADRTAIEAELGDALEAGDLEIHLQPVVELPSGLLDGYEASVRWNRPDGEPLDLTEVPPAVMSAELACAVDRWVLTGATARLAALTAAEPISYGNLTVTVPVSTPLLTSPCLLQDVRRALVDADLAPHRLAVAVNEMALVEVPSATQTLSALREAGICVTIDDFGTGRTSIAQMRHLPADTLKVHRSMVDSDEPGTYDLLVLLVNAAHACGLLVVADGHPHVPQHGVVSDPPLPTERRLRIVRDE
ncbi:hypothetical protein GCM10022234_27920 [Aeromicrobium panaciterrae]|uniref:EAL domain-containing protein n=1 Tax=Aeromicrobium panaciterrae TaxID=363861 RepID=UPI0031D58528